MARGAEPKTVLVPVLPVRDTVHFPRLISTLQVLRDPSVKALRKALAGDRLVVVVSQRDNSVEEPSSSDLYRVGTLSEALQALPLPDSSQRVTLRGLQRVSLKRVVCRGGAFWAEVSKLEDDVSDPLTCDALVRQCATSFQQIVQMHKGIPAEALETLAHTDDAGRVADSIAHHLPGNYELKQALLATPSVLNRLEMLLEALKREEQVLQLGSEISRRVEAQLGSSQREFFLREQLKIIQGELDDREHRIGEAEEYESLISNAGLPEGAASKARAEVRRLDRMPPTSPEGTVARNYLDTLVGLPWANSTEDTLDLEHASDLLEEQHFGLSPVKERILDHLAVRQLTKSLRGPILCFVGPPGVGKTSIGRSIADAMGRRFARISLGGVRDEAEIRGHRRTYVGAMPGRIIRAIRDVGSRNPVIMLDEIDKLGSDWRGDPTSALLEALDPEQNDRFEDHYLDCEFDLSSVLFVATANVPEAIPPALRDRLEIIAFPGYSDEDRVQIARNFLIPKALREHGLNGVSFSEDALTSLVQDYTRESGVRNLERQIANVCRKVARAVVSGSKSVSVVRAEQLQDYLGHPRYRRESVLLSDAVGVAVGLVVADYGGEIVRLEASLMPPHGSRPELRLTGRLGDVMRESAEAALTWVRSHAPELVPHRPFRYDTHVHVPDAGIPKDGPSAGLTIALAVLSALMESPLRGDVAMTGEITLRGRVLPVGGIREKVLAAQRAGIREVIVPVGNIPDLEELPTACREAVVVHPVANVSEAMKIAMRPLERAAVVR